MTSKKVYYLVFFGLCLASRATPASKLWQGLDSEPQAFFTELTFSNIKPLAEQATCLAVQKKHSYDYEFLNRELKEFIKGKLPVLTKTSSVRVSPFDYIQDKLELIWSPAYHEKSLRISARFPLNILFEPKQLDGWLIKSFGEIETSPNLGIGGFPLPFEFLPAHIDYSPESGQYILNLDISIAAACLEGHFELMALMNCQYHVIGMNCSEGGCLELKEYDYNQCQTYQKLVFDFRHLQSQFGKRNRALKRARKE